MTNKQEKKDGLSLKQKIVFLCGLYNMKLYSHINLEKKRTFHTLREMAE